MTLHRAAAIVALGLTVSACGGGGGGGIQTAAPVTPAPTTPAPTTPAPTTPAPTTPAPVTPAPVTPAPVTVSITAPSSTSVNGIGAPAFNFIGNPPPIGTVFHLAGPSIRSTSNGVAASGIPGSDVHATFRGTTLVNGVVYPVFDFSITSLGVSATNVRGDGTDVNLAGGGTVGLAVATLDYTVLGIWNYNAPGSGPAYLGQFASGSSTPAANVPTSGTATYLGSGASGGVLGGYFIPDGSGSVTGGTVSGDVTMNVNFGTNAVTGQFTNMTAKPLTGGSVPWNDVMLSGNIGRGGGSVSAGGTTRAAVAPTAAGSNGFTNAATGSFTSLFYGPSYNELGGTWSLSEGTPDGGKMAFGTFAGTR